MKLRFQMKGIIVKKHSGFSISMDYHYKGTLNTAIHLVHNSFGNIEVRTDFGEFVGVYSSGDTLSKAMRDLIDGKFAE